MNKIITLLFCLLLPAYKLADTFTGKGNQWILGGIEEILGPQMSVTFADAGVNTFDLDFKGYFTLFKIVGIKKNGPLIIGEPALNLGIDVIDAEIKVCMLLINFPGMNFGRQR